MNILKCSICVILLGFNQSVGNAQMPQFEWAKPLSSEGQEEVYSVAVDNYGNVYSMGFFTAEMDFDPGLDEFLMTPNGGPDIFIQKLDSLGEFIWAKQIGGSGNDGALVIPPLLQPSVIMVVRLRLTPSRI